MLLGREFDSVFMQVDWTRTAVKDVLEDVKAMQEDVAMFAEISVKQVDRNAVDDQIGNRELQVSLLDSTVRSSQGWRLGLPECRNGG